jgi:hypothetical protein
LSGTGSKPLNADDQGMGLMPGIVFILQLLLDLLLGWWREAAPLAARKDGRVQVWSDDAADAAVGQVGARLSFWPTERLARRLRPRPWQTGDGDSST